MQPINQKHIARLCGLSQATVSRVLHQSALIHKDTRRRVEQVMKKNGYVPDAAASALRSGRSRILAFILPSYRYMEGFNTARILSGLSAAANSHGYQLIVSAFRDGEDYKTGLRSIILGRKIDGIFTILNTPRPDPAIQRFVGAQEIPFVFVNSNRMEKAFFCVGTDNTGGVRRACAYLISRGRRRILFLGQRAGSLISLERVAGYRAALKESGLAYRREIIVSDATGESAYGAGVVARLLKGRQRPDALVCYDDHLAMGALKAALEVGVKVPDELAVIGFTGINETIFTFPPLTTVQEDGYAVGKTAMELMASALQKQEPAERKIQIPTRLIIRGSA